jgi:hypothetical protein
MLLGFALVVGCDKADTETDVPQPEYGVAMVDNDGDGYETPSDCDDSNAAIHPGADETPGDGVDSDCDGDD